MNTANLTNREIFELSGATEGAIYLMDKEPILAYLTGAYWSAYAEMHELHNAGESKSYDAGKAYGRLLSARNAMEQVVILGKWHNASNLSTIVDDLKRISKPEYLNGK